jgi:hypothetical protein
MATNNMLVKTIVVHQNPHLDELAAAWLLRTRGETKFPGVEKAKLVTWGKKDLANTTPEICVMNGILLVGLGGGMFDDHQDGRPDCAVTLVAKHLGVEKDFGLKTLLNGCYLADSKNEGKMAYLAAMVKDLNRYWPGSIDVEKLYKQIEPFISAEVTRQQEYADARDLVWKKYNKQIGSVRIMAANNISNRQYATAARAIGGMIVIQRDTDGLTQIFGNEDVDMAGLSIRIRRHEMFKGEIRPHRKMTDEILAGYGTIPEIPHWHLDCGNLLNGSESFPDAVPSKIPFGDVVAIVEKHVRAILAESAKPSKLESSAA